MNPDEHGHDWTLGEDRWIVQEHKKPTYFPPATPPERITVTFGGGLAILWLLWVARVKGFRKNPKVVEKTPIISVMLLEAANIQQLYRMWTTHTAAGQSISAWLSVNFALWLWLNFYLVFNRDNKFAVYGTAIGIAMNSLVILTVMWFRYIVGN